MPVSNFDAVSAGGVALQPNAVTEYPMFVAGAQTTGVRKAQFIASYAGTIVDVRAWLETAPTGATFIVDLLKNGTTLYTTPGNRPTIAISGQASTIVLPDIVAVAAGDRIALSVIQIGSTVAGSDLSVTVAVKRTNIA